MTNEDNVKRRTFMGTLAAASAGALAGPGAASSGSSADEWGSGANNHLATYASPTGRINTEGLQDAQADYQNGNITRSERNDVIRAWSTGRRVVSKDIEPLNSNISQDTTLENPSGVDRVYQVQSDINVSAELTIDAGTVIEVQQGNQFYFGSNATLLGEGTAQAPIFISATNPTRGWWGGFDIDSEDLNNKMTHVTIEYGGRNLNGNIDMADASYMELSNCTLRYSGEYGLDLGSSAELGPASQNNTYTENRAGPVWTTAANLQMLSSSSDFAGNDFDYIYVNERSVSGGGPDAESRTWQALNVPYWMRNNTSINELELTIQPGAEFVFPQQASITFGNNCRMNLDGTAQDPITFTGTEEQQGWWQGFYLRSVDSNNTMSHVTIEYGGNGSNGSCLVATGFRNDAECEIQNCTFSHADGYGMYVSGSDPELTNMQNNTYTRNSEGAARISTNELHMLSSSSSYEENGRDLVYVSDSNVNGNGPENESRTWDNIGVPYRHDGFSDIDNITLTIEPGATFEFTEASGMGFISNCKMDFVGRNPNASEQNIINPITFTGTQEQPGWWDGLYIASDLSESKMERVIVEYGGNGLNGNVDLAQARFRDSGEVKIKSCTFRNAEGYGIYAGTPGKIKNASLNLYTGNSEGAVRLNTSQMHMLSDSSDFTGNGKDRVYVVNGGSGNVNSGNVDTSTVVWENINVPFVMDNSDHVIDDVEIKIEPGVECQFQEQARLDFNSNCSMSVDGTEQNPILFTGTQEQPGWWDGVYIGTTSLTSTMTHTIIEYCGNPNGSLNSCVDLAQDKFRDNGQIEIQNCTMRNADGYGLVAGTGGKMRNAQNNRYTGNTDGAAQLNTSQMHMLSDTSDFTGNDDDRVYVVNDNDANGGNVDPGSVTWDGINVPYVMNASTHGVNDVTLTIAAGAEFQFEEQGRMTFYENSSFKMEGDSADKIIFTGTMDIKGWWDGINVQTPSLINSMDHVTMEYGGRGLGALLDMKEGFREVAEVKVTNSTFRHSRAAGILVDDDSSLRPSDACSINTFNDNDGGDCVIET